jgi:asparagine synthase (glutamine-hydrolysing)
MFNFRHKPYGVHLNGLPYYTQGTMCGILYYMGQWLRNKPGPLEAALAALVARGPEGTHHLHMGQFGTLGFTRLAINGLNSGGMQPMEGPDINWVCNGEIYNWQELSTRHGLRNPSGSDCHILGELYRKFRSQEVPLTGFFRALDGVFAIIMVDLLEKQVIIARDPFGVRPLYHGFCRVTGVPVFASEIKALLPLCDNATPFPPGHYQTIAFGSSGLTLQPRPFYAPSLVKQPRSLDSCLLAVRDSLTAAVNKRVENTEREIGCLLSGGLDSSLIAALVQAQLKKRDRVLRTFSIGMAGSEDLHYARRVAEWINSEHTEVIVTAEEMFAAVPDVIRAIESHDTTTVRASVPNTLLAKHIRATTHCKVIFNGDGSDEVWGSYMYFYNAPSNEAYEEECRRLLDDIHMFDVLRSDRSVSSNGLEPRTPYLDKQFVETVLSLPTQYRRPKRDGLTEKWCLRRAFEEDGLLPSDVLWRRKEAFSDGVSGKRSWYELAREFAAAKMEDGWKQDYRFPSTATVEQAYYFKVYWEIFGQGTISTNVPYYWMPRWSPGATDPSARELDVYYQVPT